MTKQELADIAQGQFGDFVKATVDIEKGIMSVGGELHMDGATLLMEREDSRHEHIWGINLYPEETGDSFIEFDSMVNIKPALGNRTRGVESTEIQNKIREIVGKLITS